MATNYEIISDNKDMMDVSVNNENAAETVSEDNAGVVFSEDNGGVVVSEDNAGVVVSEEAANTKANTLQIVGLVLGILAIVVCCCFALGGLAFGIAGLVCSIMGNNKGPKTGIGTAAMICSIIGIALSVINMILGAFLAASNFLPFTELLNM